MSLSTNEVALGVQLGFVLIAGLSQKVRFENSRHQQQVPYPIALFANEEGWLFVCVKRTPYLCKGSFGDWDRMSANEHFVFSDFWEQLSDLF